MNWLIAKAGFKKLWGIKWSTGYNIESHLLDLESFTFEIADKPAEPLTIDKRVKGEIEKMLKEHRGCTPDSYYIENDCDKMLAYLNSLEET